GGCPDRLAGLLVQGGGGGGGAPAGGVAHPDAGVEGGGAQPERPAVAVLWPRPPQADVVTAARVVADGLLEGQVLLAAPDEQAADWRVLVGSAEQGGHRDLQATAEGQGIGGRPAPRPHGLLPGGLAGGETPVY